MQTAGFYRVRNVIYRSMAHRSSTLLQACLILASYGFGLWWYGVPLTGDQKVYVSTAMEMFQSGNFLHPILMGEPSYIKPPLEYWAMICGWKVFGFGPFGCFFPSVMAMLLTTLSLKSIAEMLRPGPGSVSGILFACTFGTLTYATSAQMEAWIVLFYTLSWWGGLKYLGTGRSGFLYFAFLWVGVTAIAKSPLYSVLWTMGFVLYLMLMDRCRALKNPHFYFAGLLGAIVGLSWYVAIWVTDRDRFWARYVQGETLAKAMGNGGTLPHMWGDFLVSTLPVGLLLLPALFGAVRRGIGKEYRFVLAWCLAPMLFFSVFPYRTETYLYISMPAVMLLIEWGVSEINSRAPAAFAGMALQILALFVGMLFWRAGMLPFWIAACLPLAALITWVFPLRSRIVPIRAFAYSLLGLILALRVAVSWLGEDDVAGLRQVVERYPDRKVSYWDGGKNWWNEIGLLSVASRKPGFRQSNFAELRDAFISGDILVLNEPEYQMTASLLAGASEATHGTLRCEPWSRWNRGFLAPKLEDLRTMSDPSSQEWKARFRRTYWVCRLDRS